MANAQQQSDFYVYQHVRADTGNVFYVGKGVGARATNFRARGDYWRNIYNKSGAVDVQFVAQGLTEEFAYLVEMEVIASYRDLGVELCNITDGGPSKSGYRTSSTTKRKMSDSSRRLRGPDHPSYGVKRDPEVGRKISVALKGRPRPNTRGEKHHMYGKSHSEEALKKISQNRKGKACGADNHFYGKLHSVEARIKISEARIGKKASAETKRKKSESALASVAFDPFRKSVTCIDTGIIYKGLAEAERETGLHRQCIRMVCNGDLKKTGGKVFQWSQS